MAEAGVHAIEDDGGFGGGRELGGDFADVEDFEEFGDVVAYDIVVFSEELVEEGSQGVTDRSDILAVALSLSVAKISSLLFSGNCVMKWTSDVTIVNRGVKLNLVADSLSFGNASNARRKVLTTLVVICASLSSLLLYTVLAMPAFSRRISNLGRPSIVFANCFTDS